MYNTVLVPLDGSERAETILPHVQGIAQHYKAKVIFLRVLESPHAVVASDGSYEPDEEIIVGERKEEERYLKNHQDKFQELGFDAETRLIYGRAVDEICKLATKEDIDLVALTSHGRTGMARVFYGSVAVGILHRLTQPLLLVRAE